ncbi:protein arginine N-methyltransferase 2 isoform X2 [Lampetra fluviatilis]
MPHEGVQRGREELGDDGVMEGTGDHGTFTAAADYKAADLTQLSFRRGDRIVVHQQMSNEWWWAELSGCFGYVPARYFTERDPLQDLGEEDTWQDDEYFNSYSKLMFDKKTGLICLSKEAAAGDAGRPSAHRDLRCCHEEEPRVATGQGGAGCRLWLWCTRWRRASWRGSRSKWCGVTGWRTQYEYCRAASRTSSYPAASTASSPSGWAPVCCRSRERAAAAGDPPAVAAAPVTRKFEFMIESVLQARDRWLRDGGVMWPSTAALHLTPCSAQREYTDKIGFWDWQYELDFSQLRTEAAKEFFSKPKHDHQMDPDDCLAEPCCILQLDMSKVQTSDLEEITYEFIFEVKKAGPMHGFAAWFSTEFKCPDSNPSIILDTGPMSTATHWKQTLFMLDSPVAVTPGDVVVGSVALRRNPVWRRHMSVAFRWRVAPSADAPDAIGEGEKTFPLWR